MNYYVLWYHDALKTSVIHWEREKCLISVPMSGSGYMTPLIKNQQFWLKQHKILFYCLLNTKDLKRKGIFG